MDSIASSVRGSAKIISLLLGEDASWSARDGLGRTPLLKAAIHGEKQVAQLLLDRNADITPKDRVKKTAAVLAIEYGNNEGSQTAASDIPQS